MGEGRSKRNGFWARIRFLAEPVLSGGEGDGAPSKADPKLPSGTAIILFADIANSTGLTEELGDAAFREKARALDTALREAISAVAALRSRASY